MKTSIQFAQAAVDPAEALAMIDPVRLEAIKRTDATPEVRVYAVAHEGTAQGRLVGYGVKAIQYFREAVRRIHELFPLGGKVFHHHGATNEHGGRLEIGTVVGKALKEMGGRLTELVAVYIAPEHRGKTMDVASLEADVTFKHTGPDSVSVDVAEITGLALGDSKVESPGFPGAVLLAQVQAFVEGGDKGGGKQKGSSVDLEELKKAIKEGKFSPSDLFEEDALKADDTVKSVLDDAIRTASDKAAKSVTDRLKPKLDRKDEEITRLKSENAKGKVSTIVDTMATDRKLTESQKAFVLRRLGQFQAGDAETEDDIRAALNKHLDAELKEFAELASIYGVKPGEGNDAGSGGGNGAASGGGKNDGGAGAPPGDGSGGGGDLTDPKSNPFIPV